VSALNTSTICATLAGSIVQPSQPLGLQQPSVLMVPLPFSFLVVDVLLEGSSSARDRQGTTAVSGPQDHARLLPNAAHWRVFTKGVTKMVARSSIYLLAPTLGLAYGALVPAHAESPSASKRTEYVPIQAIDYDVGSSCF
jgi:hypothetical protein